jgi:hypothetical protein
MPDETAATHPFADTIELGAKLITAGLGVLYVLGILISNVQLMELGISDFTALQPRNILTGFFFALFVFWLLLIVGLALAAMVLFFRTASSRTGSLLGKLVVCPGIIVSGLILLFVAALFAGELFGYLYPWGKTWEEVETFWGHLRSARDGYQIVSAVFRQFADIYVHTKVIYASVAIFFALLFALARYRLFTAEEAEDRAGRLLFNGLIIVFLLIALPLLIFDYADEVYPNLKYNLGGGQPQIAQLSLAGKKTEIAGLPGTRTCCDDAKQEDSALRTDDVAIWYQSEKFFYVSPLPDTRRYPPEQAYVEIAPQRVRILAIEGKLVRAAEYVEKSIRIASGAQVTAVYRR